jgi:hypothetical protein
MEAASTSEMSVNFYQTTHRNNLEDSHLERTLFIYIKQDIEILAAMNLN